MKTSFEFEHPSLDIFDSELNFHLSTMNNIKNNQKQKERKKEREEGRKEGRKEKREREREKTQQPMITETGRNG